MLPENIAVMRNFFANLDGDTMAKGKKKMPKNLMIYNLKRWLKGKGIDPDLIDLEHLVDESLTYEENKRIVLEHIKPLLKKNEKDMKKEDDKALAELKQHLFRESMKINEERDEEEREKDEMTKAKHVIDLNKAKSEKQLYNWFFTWLDNLDKLDKYDIEGVDYIPELCEEENNGKDNVNWRDVLKEDKGNKKKKHKKKNKSNDKPKPKVHKLLEYTKEYLEAKNKLVKYLESHEIDKETLTKLWEELLKMEGKNVTKAKRTDKAKKAKRCLKIRVPNILKWIQNPSKYDLKGVDG